MRRKQLELPLKEICQHGGRRQGAGRKRTSRFQPHIARAKFTKRIPLHVTLRLHSELPRIRRPDFLRCLKSAIGAARAQGLAVAHFSLLSNHLHLILEASDHRELARQMRSLEGSLAKRLNRLLDRRGAAFAERYHAHLLKTPSQAKNALAYVLSNEFKHRGALGRIDLDEYSSAITLADVTWAGLLGRSWRRIVGFPLQIDPDENEKKRKEVEALLSAPRTWLLQKGWRKAKASNG